MHPTRQAGGSLARCCHTAIRRIAVAWLSVGLLSGTGELYAASNEQLESAATELRRISAESQARINALDDQARALRAQSTGLDDAVTAYEQRIAELEQRLATVESEVAAINKEAVAAENTAAQILPMMASMIERLEQFVALDLPFQVDVRRATVETLRGTMIRADLGLADKFRRIVSAWRSEIDHSYHVVTWRAQPAGEDRILELLRLGRTALYYRTPDRSSAAVWLAREKRWQPLNRAQRRALDRAFAVAQEHQPPELLTLPIALPARQP